MLSVAGHAIELDTDNQIAIVRYRGAVTYDQVPQVLEAIIAAPGWTPAFDRMFVYDEALLGDIDMRWLESVAKTLSEMLLEAYGDRVSYNDQVCDDPLKRSTLSVWVGLAAQGYPSNVSLFETEQAARAWIHERRVKAGEISV